VRGPESCIVKRDAAAHRRTEICARGRLIVVVVLRSHEAYRFLMKAESPTTEAEIWSRTIQPESGDLSIAAAREWLRLRLSSADAERVRHLSCKASDGTLTKTEEQELESYLNVARALELLKAKARQSLGG
jgi:hypothetical protein